MKLCFFLISLIGHGYWILAENRPEHVGKCDTKCGAILFAEHDRTPCINNIQFNTWDESKNDWKFDQDLSDRYIATEGMISYHGYH